VCVRKRPQRGPNLWGLSTPPLLAPYHQKFNIDMPPMTIKRILDRSATALALTDTELIPLGDKGFSLLVAYHPEFALSVLRVLVKHLRTTDAVIHQQAG
jgi:CRP-like cAMP-binding protein